MKTKVIIFGILMILLKNSNLIAQNDTVKMQKEYVAYTFFYNVVPGHFNYPLIGLVNIAKGNYKGVQCGLLNTTLKELKGLSFGLVNTTLGNSSGVQLGLVNTTLENNEKLQLGLVNTTLKSKTGLQLGLVNTSWTGIKGTQIGLLNIADTVSNGVPIGLLSIVKKGGYRAVEVSVNELFPFNMAFKIGVPQFYSFVQGSYNSNYSKPFALGLGFGSLIPLGNRFYFNPEVGNMSSLKNNTNIAMLVTNIRYSLSSKLEVSIGPSIVWLHYSPGQNIYDPPFISLSNNEINTRNRLLAGVRIALSFNFTELR